MRRFLLAAGLVSAACLSPGAQSAPAAGPERLAQGETPKDKGGEPPKDEKKKDEPKKDEKAATAEIGKAAPEFTLTDLDGKTVKLSDYKGKLVVLEWFSPACPTCDWAYSDKGPLHGLPEKLEKEGVVWLAVNSSNSENEGSKADANKKFFEKHKAKVRLLMDPEGTTGKAYGAKTTPHMYVIDEKGVLRYRGAVDNAPNGKAPEKEAKVNYVTKAIEEIKGGKAVTTSETRSYG